MEMLDIVDEYGEPTGNIKERTLVHKNGDLHRTAHVWIVRDNEKGGLDVLLQKRSKQKDSHPGCYDISSAGHIPAGVDYLESAIRELKEELGLDAQKEELEYCCTTRKSEEDEFHGEIFRDNQFSKVYRLKRNDLDLQKLIIQDEEVEEVIWMDYQECMKAIKKNTIKHCINLDELRHIGDMK